mmetsp:Transcript_33503/g.70460  ORF Transcript_33503/g.70460 Transcript_33503/m.70460 type:complete len:111 (-) Transcript_33503:67-399(-)
MFKFTARWNDQYCITPHVPALLPAIDPSLRILPSASFPVSSRAYNSHATHSHCLSGVTLSSRCVVHYFTPIVYPFFTSLMLISKHDGYSIEIFQHQWPTTPTTSTPTRIR